MVNHYIFRTIGDGMILTMILFAFVNYYRGRKITFLLYGLVLSMALIDFIVGDKVYLHGIKNVMIGSYQYEVNAVFVAIYFLFVIKMFDEYIQDIFIKRLLKTGFVAMVLYPTIMLFLKAIQFYNLLYVYTVFLLFTTIINFIIIFYHLYRFKFVFVTYFLMGSTFLFVGWALKSVFMIFPDLLPQQKIVNAFSFDSAYGEVGIILESIFMFMGISEAHKLTVKEQLNIQGKLLSSLEERTKIEKSILEMKQQLQQRIGKLYSQYLVHASQLVSKSKVLLETSKIELTLVQLKNLEILTNEFTQGIRTAAYGMDKQDSIIFNNSIESHFSTLTAYHLTAQKTTFSLYVSDSSYWEQLITEKNIEMLMFGLYESAIGILLARHEFRHLIVNLVLNDDDRELTIILQSQGNRTQKKGYWFPKTNADIKRLAAKVSQYDGNLKYWFDKETLEATTRLQFKV